MSLPCKSVNKSSQLKVESICFQTARFKSAVAADSSASGALPLQAGHQIRAYRQLIASLSNHVSNDKICPKYSKPVSSEGRPPYT